MKQRLHNMRTGLNSKIKIIGLTSAMLFSLPTWSQTTNTAEEYVWITVGKDTTEVLKSTFPKQIKEPDASIYAKLSLSDKDFRLLSVPKSQLNAISQKMHEEFNRCGGFFFHDSFASAESFFTQNKFSKSQGKAAITYSINNAQTVNSLLAQMSPQNMTATVDAMSNYYNRYYTNSSGEDAASWLLQHWRTIASNRTDISVDFFEHSWTQPSVIATIQGTTNPEEIVVIGGHLDSINGGSPVNGRAPGADDNASGIAVVTETLSAIVASDYRPARTIKIIGYAAEEVGLRGSQAIANQHASNGLNVVGAAQFDMTGFKGTNLADIVFISDYTDASQTSFMADLVDTYFPNTSYQYSNCGYACSDHASWTAAGYPASFPFESTFNDSNPRIHSSSDTSFDQAHATHFLQLSIAYVAELAKGQIGDAQLATLQFESDVLEIASGQTVTINVTRSGNLDEQVSIDYQTQNGTAIAGNDFTNAQGTLSWAAQDDSVKSIQISTSDTSSDKTFSVILSNAQGSAMIGPNQTIEVTLKGVVVPPPPPVQSSGGGSTGYGTGIALLSLLGLFSRSQRKYRKTS